MATTHAYLNFDGNAEEAFNFYKLVLGGEFLTIQRYKDMPQHVKTPGVQPEKIMHIALLIGNSTLLMGNDRPQCMGEGIKGDNFHISIVASTALEAREIFFRLSEGGHVTMPLEKAFWGATFGMLTDKYGIQWMINHNDQHLF